MSLKPPLTRDSWQQAITKIRLALKEIYDRLGTAETDIAAIEAFGRIVGAGSQASTNSSATTNVAVTGLVSTDKVLLTAADAGAASLDGYAYVSAITAGQFTITHDSSTLPRTWHWVAVRPPA